MLGSVSSQLNRLIGNIFHTAMFVSEYHMSGYQNELVPYTGGGGASNAIATIGGFAYGSENLSCHKFDFEKQNRRVVGKRRRDKCIFCLNRENLLSH